jgi:hypothetical protein
MSSETRQEIWLLLTLLPWIAFLVAIVWFELVELRNNSRAARTDERARAPRSEQRGERTPSTNR